MLSLCASAPILRLLLKIVLNVHCLFSKTATKKKSDQEMRAPTPILKLQANANAITPAYAFLPKSAAISFHAVGLLACFPPLRMIRFCDAVILLPFLSRFASASEEVHNPLRSTGASSMAVVLVPFGELAIVLLQNTLRSTGTLCTNSAVRSIVIIEAMRVPAIVECVQVWCCRGLRNAGGLGHLNVRRN